MIAPDPRVQRAAACSRLSARAGIESRGPIADEARKFRALDAARLARQQLLGRRRSRAASRRAALRHPLRATSRRAFVGALGKRPHRAAAARMAASPRFSSIALRRSRI